MKDKLGTEDKAVKGDISKEEDRGLIEIRKYCQSEIFVSRNDEARKRLEKILQKENVRYREKYGVDFIRFLECRIKTPESICAKLKRKGYEISPESMEEHLNDVCGVRVICFNTQQLYRIARMLGEEKSIEIVKIKDYVRKPKKCGYQSYHIIADVAVKGEELPVRAEIQLRTILMDAWASMDNMIRYKKKKDLSEEMEKRIEKLSKKTESLDKLIMLLMEYL